MNFQFDTKQWILGSVVVFTFLALFLACNQANQKSEDKTTIFAFDQTRVNQSKPWTSEDFRNKPENFQFAIIGDRTGGANYQGTFSKAMDQLNLLQPEFVINVGDIIEGYTRERDELHSQWDEVDKMIAKLKMPFFITPGNHDLSYPEAKEVWKERFGKAYYYFTYHDVLFLVLDSEDAPRLDPPPGMEESIKLYNRLQTEDPEKAREMLADFMKDETVIAGLSKPVEFPTEQLNWIKKCLQDHPDVRWTFLFMHEPSWENPSESFKEIQSLLKDRKFTWFAGHLHYYDYDNIEGHEYITMGPAGASFHHEGPGNVDHITWVTMTEEGPEIGNIALKGLFDRRGLDTTMFGAYDRKGFAQ